MVVVFRYNMYGVTFVVYFCVKSAFLISVVFHSPAGAVGLVQTVFTFHDIAVTVFVLIFMVVSVGVLYFVCELVFRMTLLDI